MFWESYSMKGLMNMKNDKYRTYIYWGVTALTVLLLLVAAVFVVMRWSLVAALGAKIANILAPVIYGSDLYVIENTVARKTLSLPIC